MRLDHATRPVGPCSETTSETMQFDCVVRPCSASEGPGDVPMLADQQEAACGPPTPSSATSATKVRVAWVVMPLNTQKCEEDDAPAHTAQQRIYAYMHLEAPCRLQERLRLRQSKDMRPAHTCCPVNACAQQMHAPSTRTQLDAACRLKDRCA
eukprot:1157372-Pelagomonas_calceolata.AAC.1